MGLSNMNLSLSLSFCIHAIVLLLYLNSATSGTVAGGNETDLQALLEVKAKITRDPFAVLSSWNGTIHFCQWHGVRCSRQHQRVTVLNLQSLKLEGSISPYVGNLSFLKELNLQNNSLTREIPQEIGCLCRLKDLKLNNNSIGGKIPTNLSSCSNLIAINLGYNKLEGGIPSELGALLKLQFFSLFNNNLTGSIPHSLGNLSYLETLALTSNCLVGSVPDSLGQLNNLAVASFASNSLSGTVPPSIFNLSSVELLDFGLNNLEGNLPPEMFTSLPNLLFFSIGANKITGSIPVSLSNASFIVRLQLPKNKLSGKMPCLGNLQKLQSLALYENYLGSGEANDLSFLFSMTNATVLEVIDISSNNFGGALPEQICNFSVKLSYLLLNSNQIFGSIPSKIDDLVDLQCFEVGDNHLSGIIPSNVGKLQNLKKLILSGNMLSGHIPHSIGNLTSLIDLEVNENDIQGSIPSALGECKKLLQLNLFSNHLSGVIPPQVFHLSSLSKGLDLSNNQLRGVLPKEIGNMINLGFLDLSENMLSGEIPSTLGSCVELETLNMYGNFLQGPIPSPLSSLRGLQVLDLSQNNLSGGIPGFLSLFDMLWYLNLSDNNFEGMVPTSGVFGNACAIFMRGNAKLCGGIPELHLPACISDKISLIPLVPAVIFGLFGVTLLLYALFLLCFEQKRKQAVPSNYSMNTLLELSYGSLFQATDGFSSANMVGAGSFGSVYKGKLCEGGQLVAVKVLNLMHHGAFESFKAECVALRNIRHRNLVKVLTACSSTDYHGYDFKALVYEFMVNGSLEDWLHPAVGTTDQADVLTRSLNLLQRMNIAIDVACALVYLHHHCVNPIVHCDLKPSNILLDEEMTGHVGDFGLARILREGNHSSNIGQSSSIGVRGTVGYAPPEYGMGNEASTRGDVYSYGILLLEMFTGKRPTDDMFNEDDNLHNFVRAALPDQAVQIVDPVLFDGQAGETSTSNLGSSARNQRMLECLISTLGIGVACSTELPCERMCIYAVVDKLKSVRHKLLGT